LLYYVVLLQDLLSFLSTQINKYYFLFKHMLTQTVGNYLLLETIIIVIALQAL
ncbi:hypothetical protein P280DRAFT_414004, partial [Massarina eburnea CBS 473.64]